MRDGGRLVAKDGVSGEHFLPLVVRYDLDLESRNMKLAVVWRVDSQELIDGL